MSSLADKAREYLSRVIDDHPDTSWALLAERELRSPLSWEWTQTFTDLSPPQPNPGNNNPRPRRDDQPLQLAKPKPRRPVPKL